MRNTFTKKQTGLAFACALALGVLSGTTGAQVRQDEHAVVIDSRGVPVTSGFGLCMRSGFVLAPSWTAACRGEAPVVPVALYVAPDSESIMAIALKAYLVGQGSAWKRVQTSARGETQPSTGAGECNDANNAKNVACMQPERHVFIEASGSRIAK